MKLEFYVKIRTFNLYVESSKPCNLYLITNESMSFSDLTRSDYEHEVNSSNFIRFPMYTFNTVSQASEQEKENKGEID